jgi:acyl carrier protein
MNLDLPMPTHAAHQSAQDTLKAIVAEVLQLPLAPASITADTNLYELGLESLNVVEMLARIEAELGIVFDIEDLSADLFATFGSLAGFVQARLARA